MCRISQILSIIIPRSKGKKGFGILGGLFNRLELGVIIGKNLVVRIRILTVYIVLTGKPFPEYREGILGNSGGVWLCNWAYCSRVQSFLGFWEALWIPRCYRA